MDYLTIAVIAIAVAQALTILLSIGREREIKKLRELVNEQRLHIVKQSAWLAGRNAAQLPRIKSEHEPIREPIAKAPEPAITPKDLPDTFKWFREDTNEPREIVTGLKGRVPPEAAITPQRPSATEDEEAKRMNKAINSLREDADRVQSIFSVLHRTPPPDKIE
jgi:hypothetical protein